MPYSSPKQSRGRIHKTFDQQESELASLKSDFLRLREAGYEVVQYDQCQLNLNHQQKSYVHQGQLDTPESIAVCVGISEESGSVSFMSKAKKALNGADMAEYFQWVRDSFGPGVKLAAFGDNASINRCRVAREACQSESADITLIYNVTYRSDLLGVHDVWESLKKRHKFEIDELISRGEVIDHMKVVNDVLRKLQPSVLKVIAKKGWKKLEKGRPVSELKSAQM